MAQKIGSWFEFFPGKHIEADAKHAKLTTKKLSISSIRVRAAWNRWSPVLIFTIAERTNAFVTLVFGYSVLALLYQNHAAFGINAYACFNSQSLGQTNLRQVFR